MFGSVVLSVALLAPVSSLSSALPEVKVQAPKTSLDLIEAAFVRGELSAARRQWLRVQAVKNPLDLPSTFAAPVAVPTRRSATTVLVEAWQWASRIGAEGEPVRALMGPPDDMTYVLDSETLPLRVSFSDPNLAPMAQHVLEASEISWQVETEEYGFMVPPIESSTDRYRILIDEIGGSAGAYTSPYGYDHSVPWSSCFTYIVFNANNSDGKVDTTMAHELNHAMQAAMDCQEVTTFWENSATYIMGKVFPRDWSQTTDMYPFFQNQPWRPLSYMNTMDSDLYEYGGALWLYYLTERFAPNNGPVLLRQLWEACQQDAGYSNEPDYFDAVTNVLADGQQSAFDDLFVDFSEARYFVGGEDDGQHLPDVSNLRRAEVYQVRHLDGWSLPIVNESPSENLWPQPYGSNHLRLDLSAGFITPLKVSFFASNDVHWRVQVLGLSDGALQRQEIPLDPDLGGSVVVDSTGLQSLLLVVNNVGDGRFDPDTQGATGSYYRYSIVPAAPQVDAVEPAQLAQDSETKLRISGAGFAEIPGLELRFADLKIQVQQMLSVNDGEIVARVKVAADTDLGDKTFYVVQPGGEQREVTDLLSVVAKVVPAPDPEQAGCQCGAASHDAPNRFLALLLVGLVSMRWRRRR